MSKFAVPYFQTPNEIFKMDLKTNEKLVYIYLCRCGNDGKNAFPSYQTIAKNCSIGKSTAIKCMNALVDKGLVVKQYRFKEGENYSNVYKVDYDLGGLPERLGGVAEKPGDITERPNKELDIKNQIEKNNNLHHSTNDGLSLYKLLEAFSLDVFKKKLRKHNGSYDLECYNHMDGEDFTEMLYENIGSYDKCNFDYLQEIQFRFM